MRIVILDSYAFNPGDLSWDMLKKFGELEIYDRTPEEKIEERIGDAEIIFTNKTPIDKNVLDNCESIKYIGVLATGYNLIDIKSAREKNIIVSNIPGYSTSAVAQHTFALLLEITNAVGKHNNSIKKGEWSNCSDFSYSLCTLTELKDKTMGIIGYGNIGKSVARIAYSMGMNVLYYNPSKKAPENNYFKQVSIDELYSNSDVISLNCPLLKETEKMINKNSIAKMKDGVIIINTSRGAIIDEYDLAEALKIGKVYVAASDVVTHEPIKEDNPLLNLSNMILTPHIAWAGKETRQRGIEISVNNLKHFLDGTPINVVN